VAKSQVLPILIVGRGSRGFTVTLLRPSATDASVFGTGRQQGDSKPVLRERTAEEARESMGWLYDGIEII
jgi:hypothetical protein